ncbi:hypothetical protein LCGC14_2060980 [marine sediment metagenome]|uniref:Uncharacterized protein n=1 Tax=marine sediment metagenome TaxID=412755 RepID=A0A0F9EL64_9ZZZZ
MCLYVDLMQKNNLENAIKIRKKLLFGKLLIKKLYMNIVNIHHYIDLHLLLVVGLKLKVS